LTSAAACAEARPGKKQKLAAPDDEPKFHPTGETLGYRGKTQGAGDASTSAAEALTSAAACAEARPDKKLKLTAPDDKPKFHPTGETRGYRGKTKGGLTLSIEDFAEQSEFPHMMVVYIDKNGGLFSMHGDDLELACGKPLHKFLKKCVKKGNTIVRVRHEEGGMQNGVHADMLQQMMDDAEEKDEELDDDNFDEELHELIDALGDKFECVDKFKKTCCQPADLHLFVYRCD
jgi:hypothetical protein